MIPTGSRRFSPRKSRRGYTLIEVTMAASVFSILFLGAVGMYITMLRLCASVTGSASASLDAANAVSRVTNALREAHRVTLLDNPTYDSTDTGGNVVAVTGLQINFADTMPSAPSAGNPTGNPTVSVSTGVGTPSLTGVSALWDHAHPSATQLKLYRANGDGTPNPNTGQYLWALGTENGQAVNAPVVRDIASATDAVQFIAPVNLANEIMDKFTCAAYDPIHGSTSSDEANGTVSSLTGECVYLRDHDPTAAVLGGVNGRRQN